MSVSKKNVLIATTGAADYESMKKVMDEGKPPVNFYWAATGKELLDCLSCRGKFKTLEPSAVPQLIFLDFRLQGPTASDVLKQIKSDEQLKKIPVIVFSDGVPGAQARLSYELGSASFIPRPSASPEFEEAVRLLKHYWLEIVELPPNA